MSLLDEHANDGRGDWPPVKNKIIMTPQEQRIAIAEACGWEKIDVYQPMSKGYCGYYWSSPDKSLYVDARDDNDLPDYLNDLNTMHEAEKVLKLNSKDFDKDLIWIYVNKLQDICNVQSMEVNHQSIDIICATSQQRAEAFLRTLNLWKEVKKI